MENDNPPLILFSNIFTGTFLDLLSSVTMELNPIVAGRNENVCLSSYQCDAEENSYVREEWEHHKK